MPTDLNAMFEQLRRDTMTNHLTDPSDLRRAGTRRRRIRRAGLVTAAAIGVAGVALAVAFAVPRPLSQQPQSPASGPDQSTSPTATVDSDGVWMHPLPPGSGYYITDKFNGRYFSGTYERHYGTDLAVAAGTPIRAVHDGIVTMCQAWGTYGNFVEIRHDTTGETYSRYGHASTLLCEVGQQVTAGDIIALVGATGRATGNHLHFEIRFGGGDDPTARIFEDPVRFMHEHGVDLAA